MEQSSELIELIRRIYARMSVGDVAFFERHISRQDGVLVIGSDPGEWWADYATIVRVFKTQLEEMGSLSIDVGQIDAYSDGNVGWAAGRPVLRLPDGTAFTHRTTLVFQRQQGEWKIVQWHGSIGASNADVLGKDLTTA
jgi:hypothetical protein